MFSLEDNQRKRLMLEAKKKQIVAGGSDSQSFCLQTFFLQNYALVVLDEILSLRNS